MTESTSASQGRIVVRRGTGRRDAWRRYRIEVDGEVAGHVGPGEELVIATTAGLHVVQGRIDWSGSPKIQVVVACDRTPNLLVRAHGPFPKALLRLRFASRSRYLALEETDVRAEP